jgi:hypothetical protein
MHSSAAARNALECVLEAKENESLVIFCDDVRVEVGEAFHEGAKSLGLHTNLVVLETNENVFRKQLPTQHKRFLTTQRPGIYINLLRGTREETPFRINSSTPKRAITRHAWGTAQESRWTRTKLSYIGFFTTETFAKVLYEKMINYFLVQK